MKSFLIKSSLFVFLLLITILAVFNKADGYSDAFYIRLTTPKQSSLIIGTSKAAQGLKPNVLNQQLNRKDIYNYAFTLRLSPYGPTYLKGIKRKLKEDSNQGVFIVAVDPWSVFADSETPNDPETLLENKTFMDFTKSIDTKPNYSYLINAYDDMYVKILYNNSLMFLHENGWLEVCIDTYENKTINKTESRYFYFDSLSHEKHLESSIKRYLNKTKNYNFSELRLEYLKKTIEYLKTRGEVYLVRLPVHEDMIEIENSIMSNFNKEMNSISNDFKVNYFDLTYLNSNCIFNDGNHLNRESAILVSRELAKKINQK